MHIPDGFINGATSAGAGVIAAGGLGVSLRRAGQVLMERAAPMIGLVAAFVFALQMLNFPVANGTSGHLLGGVLAAVLVGPWIGALCIFVVLVVQALLFADGGISALGLSTINMAFIGCLGGYVIFVGLRRLLPATRGGVLAATGIAAWASVPLAAGGFVIEYAIGGNGDAPLSAVAGSMIGVHILIGIGEGIISGLVVGAVLASRPDLVYGAPDLEPDIDLEIDTDVGVPEGAPVGGATR